MEGSYKAAKGLIRVRATILSGYLSEVQIAGDFFMYPEDGLWNLEHALIGTEVSRKAILSKIRACYDREHLLTPGVTPEDFTEAIIRTISGSP